MGDEVSLNNVDSFIRPNFSSDSKFISNIIMQIFQSEVSENHELVDLYQYIIKEPQIEHPSRMTTKFVAQVIGDYFKKKLQVKRRLFMEQVTQTLSCYKTAPSNIKRRIYQVLNVMQGLNLIKKTRTTIEIRYNQAPQGCMQIMKEI